MSVDQFEVCIDLDCDGLVERQRPLPAFPLGSRTPTVPMRGFASSIFTITFLLIFLGLGGVSEAVDCQPNGIPDDVDIANCVNDPACADCNNNDAPDGCDLQTGESSDSNVNGIPDECEGGTCGDGVRSCVSGEQCDGADDALCPGHCLSDCSCPNARFFWTSVDGVVRRFDVGEPDIQSLVSDQIFPWGIAINRCEETMYWTDPDGRTLMRGSTEGLNQQTLNADRMNSGIAIDPVENKLYWTTWGQRGLYRANFDGSGEQLLRFMDNPNAIAIDFDVAGRRIYGNGITCTPDNVCNGVLWKIDPDGANFEIIKRLERETYPIDIAFDPVDRKLYWTEMTTWRLRRANMDGSGIETLTALSTRSHLALDSNARKIYWSDFDPVNRYSIYVDDMGWTGRQVFKSGLPAEVSGLERVPFTNRNCAIDGNADCESNRLDCNGNLVWDDCDLDCGASLDCNSNRVPDECETGAPPPTPLSNEIPKSRFISFSVPASPNPRCETALRVRLASLHQVNPPYTGGPSVPFSSFEGEMRWVGHPARYLESTPSGTPFHAAVLQCAPFYWDWSTISLLHVSGSAIVPSSIYEVEQVDGLCRGSESSCTAVSALLSLRTARWGDVEQPYNPPSTEVQPDLGDISALVNKFRNSPGAPIKSRALLASGDVFGTIDIASDLSFIHISACVDAFRGRPYPHLIEACP